MRTTSEFWFLRRSHIPGSLLLPLGKGLAGPSPAWPCMVAARAAAWISSQVIFYEVTVHTFVFFDNIVHLLIIVRVTQ